MCKFAHLFEIDHAQNSVAVSPKELQDAVRIASDELIIKVKPFAHLMDVYDDLIATFLTFYRRFRVIKGSHRQVMKRHSPPRETDKDSLEEERATQIQVRKFLDAPWRNLVDKESLIFLLKHM